MFTDRINKTWLEGAPAKSMWVGLKLQGKTSIEIQTFRCSRCGYRESFAPSNTHIAGVTLTLTLGKHQISFH